MSTGMVLLAFEASQADESYLFMVVPNNLQTEHLCRSPEKNCLRIKLNAKPTAE